MKGRPLHSALWAATVAALVLRALAEPGRLALPLLLAGAAAIATGAVALHARPRGAGIAALGLLVAAAGQAGPGSVADALALVAILAAGLAAAFVQRLTANPSGPASATPGEVPGPLLLQALGTVGLAAAATGALLAALGVGAGLVSARWAASLDQASGAFLSTLALLALLAVTGTLALRVLGRRAGPP
jgi:hypothetical protein